MKRVWVSEAEQVELFKATPVHKYDVIEREQLIQMLELQKEANRQLQANVNRLKALKEELQEQKLSLGEELVVMKGRVYGRSSEKSKSLKTGKKKIKRVSARKQKPSERYPEALIIEQELEYEKAPQCDQCQSEMKKSGLFEESEYLTMVPAEYYIIRQKRHKYNCGKCYGCMKTVPSPKRINKGSSYGDRIIMDAAISKYCDLIPMERYSAMARRSGLEGNIPANSLIEQSHVLAEFVGEVYEKIKQEIKVSSVILADETPHRMLEGSKKPDWYLWGFSTKSSSYFECRDTRSGDVASEFLKGSRAEYLMSDVFSGYGKAVRETNKVREGPPLKNVYCNAHARRKFKESVIRNPELSKVVGQLYGKIYRLEKIAKNRSARQVRRLRGYMAPIFKKIKDYVEVIKLEVSNKSKASKAIDYFLKNYEGLTRFIDTPEVPIDNNTQERLLRSPVIGRKTWYGTHSPRGAKTMAVMFSIIQSCHLNKVNPREYFPKIVQQIHAGLSPMTPHQYKIQQTAQ